MPTNKPSNEEIDMKGNKFDTGPDNAGFDNKPSATPKPDNGPTAGTHSTGDPIDLGLSEQKTCNSSPDYNGMNTVGKDQKPQATPATPAKKNGNTFTFK